jgi:signal transduction histidine kinase
VAGGPAVDADRAAQGLPKVDRPQSPPTGPWTTGDDVRVDLLDSAASLQGARRHDREANGTRWTGVLRPRPGRDDSARTVRRGQHRGRGDRAAPVLHRRAPGASRPAPSLLRALSQFAAAGLVAMLVLAAVGTTVLHRDSNAEALREARVMTTVYEQAVRPYLTDGLVAGQPAALAEVDAAVRRLVLSHEVERVKVWTADGLVVYADDARLIGSRFTLGPEEQRTLRTGTITSDVSDLDEAENRLDPGPRLLEVYVRSTTATGVPLLFESYLRYDGVVASAHRITADFAPAVLATLVALQLLQLPLAWRMVRRLQQGQRDREALHARAAEASEAERKRIAGDLHDGVVQTLAGVSYALAAAAVEVGSREPGAAEDASRTISSAATLTRRSIGELRSLLVDIYPPNLHEVGLTGALATLTASLPARGLVPHLDVPTGLRLAPAVEELLYRAAQEAVRNVVAHARATQLFLSVREERGRAALEVRDDGCGFMPVVPQAGTPHFGLRLLDEMADRRGGSLRIESMPGLGTTLLLEVPAR